MGHLVQEGSIGLGQFAIEYDPFPGEAGPGERYGFPDVLQVDYVREVDG